VVGLGVGCPVARHEPCLDLPRVDAIEEIVLGPDGPWTETRKVKQPRYVAKSLVALPVRGKPLFLVTLSGHPGLS